MSGSMLAYLASLPRIVAPNAVDWTNITGSTVVQTNTQTITGITDRITLSFNVTNSGATATYGVYVNGAFTTVTNAATFSVAPGDTVKFEVEWSSGSGSASGTVTIKNVSNGNATLDTFTYSVAP